MSDQPAKPVPFRHRPTSIAVIIRQHCRSRRHDGLLPGREAKTEAPLRLVHLPRQARQPARATAPPRPAMRRNPTLRQTRPANGHQKNTRSEAEAGKRKQLQKTVAKATAAEEALKKHRLRCATLRRHYSPFAPLNRLVKEAAWVRCRRRGGWATGTPDRRGTGKDIGYHRWRGRRRVMPATRSRRRSKHQAFRISVRMNDGSYAP